MYLCRDDFSFTHYLNALVTFNVAKQTGGLKITITNYSTIAPSRDNGTLKLVFGFRFDSGR